MTDASDRADTLKSLHTALIDSRNGYQEALEDSKGKGLSGLFREMIELRDHDAKKLGVQLVAMGETPDQDGSFMTTVHRAVIKVRSLFTDLDESILPGLIDGEERILGYYREAIDAARGAPYESILKSQQMRLQQKIGKMRSLAAA